MNKPLPDSLSKTQVAPQKPAVKRAYHAPTMVEYGNVRDLTKGTGVSGNDKSGTRRTGAP